MLQNLRAPFPKNIFGGLLFIFSKTEEINDTLREKLYFIQFSTRMAVWPLLTFFNQLSSFIHSITRIKEGRYLKNVIHEILVDILCLLR